MGILGDDQAFVVGALLHAALFERLLVGSGGGDRQIEDLRHRGALRALIG